MNSWFAFSQSDWVGGTAAVVAFAIVAWGVWRAWRIRPMPKEPRCAACHYVLIGGVSDRCPECGGEIRETGIIPAGTTTLNIGRIAAWTAAMVILGMICGRYLDFRLASYSRHDAHARIHYRSERAELAEVKVTARAEGWQGPPSPQSLDIEYAGGGDRGKARYDFKTGVWTVTQGGSTHQVANPLTSAEIQRWFASRSLHPGIADDIRAFLQDAAALRDVSSLSASIRLSPSIAFTGISYGSGFAQVLFSVSTGYYLQWLCFVIWGVMLPLLRPWQSIPMFGGEAAAHLQKHEVGVVT